MDIRQLTTFRMVTSTLNFTQAAAALGCVQSNVTAQIKSLEAELGTQLFNRLGKGITVTQAGERLLPYADKMLDMVQEARDAVNCSDQPAGNLVISAAETICTYRLPPLLRRYRQRWPGVRLVFKPYPVAELKRVIMDGKVDVAFILEQPVRIGGLVIEPLVTEEVVLIAPPDHPATRKAQVAAADLKHEPILFTELGCDYRNQFERILIKNGIYPSTALEFTSIETIKKCVMNHMGIAVLPEIAVRDELAANTLVALAWREKPIRVTTQMVWHKNKTISVAQERFIKTAREWFDSRKAAKLAKV